MLKHIVISSAIQAKLEERHRVSRLEICQCFLNNDAQYLKDQREEHNTDPPTLWFLAETDKARLLKVVFVSRDGNVFIKTAYEPNSDEIRIFNKLTSHPGN